MNETDRARILAAIKTYGLEEIKEYPYYRCLLQMVTGFKFSEKHGGVPILAVGFQDLNTDLLELYTECIIECTENPTEKASIQETYDFWKAHRREILLYHGAHE